MLCKDFVSFPLSGRYMSEIEWRLSAISLSMKEGLNPMVFFGQVLLMKSAYCMTCRKWCVCKVYSPAMSEKGLRLPENSWYKEPAVVNLLSLHLENGSYCRPNGNMGLP